MNLLDFANKSEKLLDSIFINGSYKMADIESAINWKVNKVKGVSIAMLVVLRLRLILAVVVKDWFVSGDRNFEDFVITTHIDNYKELYDGRFII